MIKKSISNKDVIKIFDETTNTICYGCKQEWYDTDWQRISGCGPTTAANIIIYLTQMKILYDNKIVINSKDKYKAIMNEAWKYVTPTNEGIKTAELFYNSFILYASSKNIVVDGEYINVSKNDSITCSFEDILSFIERALNKDVPIAFLNLSNGDEKNLQEWHWVTIISLEYTNTKDFAFVEIVDDGIVKRIDLSLWYNTTRLDGGFAYFYF